MVIEGEQACIEVELRPERPCVYEGLPLAVRVRSGPFAGASDRLWVAVDEYERFLAGLREFERTRRGEAMLEAMSPGELRLRFRAADRAGHLTVEVTVADTRLGEHAWHTQSVTCSFPLDPGRLPGLVRDFTDLRSAWAAG